MKRCELLILGGGIAGWTAAETLRKILPNAEICIVSEENELLYSRILLPHYIKGQIPREKVFLRRPDSHIINNIIFLGGVFAKKIDVTAKAVFLSDGSELGYGKLLIATGGASAVPPISGFNLEGVYQFRTLADADKIAAGLRALEDGSACAAAGSSFISLEFPHLFASFGLKTHIILRGEGFFHRYINKEAVSLIEAELCANGAVFHKNEDIEAFVGSGSLGAIKLKSGETLSVKFAGVGFGLTPNLSAAASAGIEINKGIITNEYLETNAPEVWSAGDVTEFFDIISGRQRRVGNWVNAQEQGRLAAANMAGERKKLELVSSYALNIFKLPVAFIGDVEIQADDKIVEDGSAKENRVTRLILRNGTIAGAILVGNLEKRSLITQAIKNKINFSDVRNLIF